MAQPHPTLIGLPPAPSAPDTPSEVPYATPISFSFLSRRHSLMLHDLHLVARLPQQRPPSPPSPPPPSRMAIAATPSRLQPIVVVITNMPHKPVSKPSAPTAFLASPGFPPFLNSALAQGPSPNRPPIKAPAPRPHPRLLASLRLWLHRFSVCLHTLTLMANLPPLPKCLPVAQRLPLQV